MAIGVTEVVPAKGHHLPCPVKAPGAGHDIISFPAITARIHRQGTTNGSGNSGIELQTRQPGLGGSLSYRRVEGSGIGYDLISIHHDLREGLACQTDDHTLYATIPHDHIGADPKDRDRNLWRQLPQEVRQIVWICGQEKYIGGAADPKPSKRAQVCVGQKSSTNRG